MFKRVSNILTFKINITLIIYRNTPKLYYRKLRAFLRISYDNSIQEIKQIIQKQTENNKGISIQLDIWSSIDSYGYLGVIMNFINKDLNPDYRLIGIVELLNFLLILNTNYKYIGFEILEEAHTGDYIYEIFKNNILIPLELPLETFNRYLNI